MTKRTVIFAALAGVSLLGLIVMFCSISAQPDMLLFTGEFSQNALTSFSDILSADSAVISYGGYAREDGIVLQDEHMRHSAQGAAMRLFGYYTPAYPIEMVSGRFLLPEDADTAVLNAKQASELFAAYDCIGRIVWANEKSYTVVGVYRSKGIASYLSQMGSAEAFFSDGSPTNTWLVNVEEGKSNQKEYTLLRKLEEIGVTSAHVSPLFRIKKTLTFIIAMQGYILLLILLLRQKRHPNKQIRLVCRLLWTVGILASPAFLFQYFPISPAWLPSAITATAIQSKAVEFLRLWNNARPVPTAESNQLIWLARETGVICIIFWVSLHLYVKKG